MKRTVYFVASLSLLVATTASADRWRRPHRPRPPEPQFDLGRLQAITTACQNAFDGAANEQTCVQTVNAGRGRFDPASTISACENAFDGDANELTCVRTMTSSWLPVSAVSACENAFDGDANEQACLDTVVGSRYDAAQLVSFCEQNYDGDANELACIGQYR